MRIQQLDAATANRIAAGEVVERPSSVIKELCENAIDAGATALTIEIERGGMERMRVTDNGGGIHPEDMPLAFMRHATGKIRSGDSLMAIETLGFRGEALSSIAAVAQVEMVSRQKNAQIGSRIMIHGGEIKAQSECGGPEGTSVTVDHLFYNTPARLKFAKSTQAETAQISDVVQRVILSNPHIAIRFFNNGKLVLQSPGTDLRDAIQAVYGTQISRQLIPILPQPEQAVQFGGYVGFPEISRQNRSMQTLIVNGRPIRNTALANAVQHGYRQQLMIGRFPFFVIAMQLPHAAVDVNVHPQKLQVRFVQETSLCEMLERAVYTSLDAFYHPSSARPAAQTLAEQQTMTDVTQPGSPSPMEDDGGELLSSVQEKSGGVSFSALQESLDAYRAQMPAIDHTITPQVLREGWGMDLPELGNTSSKEEAKPAEQLTFQAERNDFIGQPRVLAQLFETYVLVQSEENFYIIDQHAAHERLNFDAYMQQAEQGEVQSQQLLMTEMIELTFAQMQQYQEMEPIFHAMGFETEAFGTNTVAVRAIPAVLQQCGIRQVFHDVLDQQDKGAKLNTAELRKQRLIRSACRHSIKAGDALSMPELQALIEKLKGNAQLTCPHGRPIALCMTKHDLEKGFKRIV